MIKFELVLEETTEDDGEFTGRQVSKIFERPTLPDLDHTVIIDGNGYPVREIEHWLERSDDADFIDIRVLVPWPKSDFQALWQDKSWYNEDLS